MSTKALSDMQALRVEEFRQRLKAKPTSTEQSTSKPPSEPYDDAKLLEFLKLHKFSVDEAHAHYTELENWRLENRIEETYMNVDCKSFNRATSLHGIWIGRRDRQGRPIHVWVLRNLDPAEIAAYLHDAAELKASHPHHCESPTAANAILFSTLLEYFKRFTIPICNAVPNRPDAQKPVVSGTSIVDISGVSIRQWWQLKDHINEASKLHAKYSPDTLDQSFVVGAPPFLPWLVGAVQKWFSPSMMDVTFLQNSDIKKKLLEYVDADDLPKRFGGNLDWDYGKDPVPDDEVTAILEKDGRKGWVDGPCVLEDGVRVPVGTVNGVKRYTVDI
ncbi:CRAL/TRIO domain-containing protein [Amniculicola lignicola CBS 123094]|uniref:CRAL/TRIO domain-containing protein n=1 Tax=Amniculicola lignicola CBS 123094 TaxID=1392246 RepID=A0A6A5WY15_9PLEO|nr:CRAL/TRIO domain-containing protein [Amniculicola lignicola CBS 123094]